LSGEDVEQVEFEIEAIETPAGRVPTVETIKKLVEYFNTLGNTIRHLRKLLTEFGMSIENALKLVANGLVKIEERVRTEVGVIRQMISDLAISLENLKESLEKGQQVREEGGERAMAVEVSTTATNTPSSEDIARLEMLLIEISEKLEELIIELKSKLKSPGF